MLHVDCPKRDTRKKNVLQITYNRQTRTMQPVRRYYSYGKLNALTRNAAIYVRVTGLSGQ
jgi:hypothetical protein